MGTLRVAGFSLEDLHNGAVFSLTGCDGMVGRQAFGAEECNVFASQLQRVFLFARLEFVGCNDDGATGFGLHSSLPCLRDEAVRKSLLHDEKRTPEAIVDRHVVDGSLRPLS